MFDARVRMLFDSNSIGTAIRESQHAEHLLPVETELARSEPEIMGHIRKNTENSQNATNAPGCTGGRAFRSLGKVAESS
jgi:hypothetical protein